jgi:hypothetical protein
LVRAAETLLRFEEIWESLDQEDFTITQIKIVHPGVLGGEYRLVVKARVGGKAVVAFHSGDTLSGLLVGFVNRIENRSLKFKEDQYA